MRLFELISYSVSYKKVKCKSASVLEMRSVSFESAEGAETHPSAELSFASLVVLVPCTSDFKV